MPNPPKKEPIYEGAGGALNDAEGRTHTTVILKKEPIQEEGCDCFKSGDIHRAKCPAENIHYSQE